MNQAIDPIKLKAAAEHLEWLLRQYPDNEDVQALLSGLKPLIEDAKAGRVVEPVERIPFAYDFGDGIYTPYRNPNIDDAYVAFAIEMRGGSTEQEERLYARIEAMQMATKMGDKS
jgi:hypothetical protein